MIQISTDYVFDGTQHTPYVEDDDTCPNSVYGKTKLVGELNVQKLCQRSMIIRTAWLYSTFGNNFVKTMLRLGAERESLSVVYDQIGTPTYAADLARAIMTIAENRKPGNSNIYHFTNLGVCSWYDFTLEIHRLAGIKTCKVAPILSEQYPQKTPRPHYSVLDKQKIQTDFGVDIPHWTTSLARCIELLQQ